MRHYKKSIPKNTLIFAITLTIFIIAGRIAAYPASVRDIISGHFVEGLTVKYPAVYTIFAPVFQFADLLTMLGRNQMLILLLYINVAWFVWRIASLISRNVTGTDLFGEMVRFVGINAFVILCIALAIMVPRPFPNIVLADPDIIVLDFHTHTAHSWDGRSSATLSNQIQRRRAGGFDAFFVTDHHNRYITLDPEFISAGKAGNTNPIPFRGEEISLSRFNLIVLGPDVGSSNIKNPNLSKAMNLLLKNKDHPETLVVATTDVDWWKHPEILDPLIPAGLNGIELAKASPRGLELTVEDRERMVRYARKNNLIITGASDNHGFGYTDYVWNLLRLPGWQSMDPAELEKAVLQEVRKLQPGALTIVTRIKAEATRNIFLMAIDPPRQIWEMLRSLPWAQAAVFVVYAWIPFFIMRFSQGTLKRG